MECCGHSRKYGIVESRYAQAFIVWIRAANSNSLLEAVDPPLIYWSLGIATRETCSRDHIRLAFVFTVLTRCHCGFPCNEGHSTPDRRPHFLRTSHFSLLCHGSHSAVSLRSSQVDIPADVCSGSSHHDGAPTFDLRLTLLQIHRSNSPCRDPTVSGLRPVFPLDTSDAHSSLLESPFFVVDYNRRIRYLFSDISLCCHRCHHHRHESATTFLLFFALEYETRGQ